MDSKEFSLIIDATFSSIQKLSRVKGGEYAPSESDRLANFKEAGKRQDLIPEKVLLVYLDKHFAAISNYVSDLAKGKTRERSEGIEGRVDDLILYGILLKGLLVERHEFAQALNEETKRLDWEGEE